MNRLNLLALLAAIWVGAELRSLFNGEVAHAQNVERDWHIEPGTTVVRDPVNGVQMQGKIVIDRRTGDVWGFPTASSAPCPVVLGSGAPPTSVPVYLGRFDFARARRP